MVFDIKIEEDKISRTCSMHRRQQTHRKFNAENLKGKYHLGHSDTNGSIILKHILKK
jgi:hypothetical protein